jgi:outer membrane receptor protein involved in Fe transport
VHALLSVLLLLAAETPVVEGEEVVVTARREEQPAFESDRTVHAVRLEGQRSVPEALEETPGVVVQQTNRGAGAPILRGLIGPQNLIVVDGVRFNNSTFRTGPNQHLTLLDPASLDRVEVMLGPGSVLYGSDAMGGVVQAAPVALPSRDGYSGGAGAGLWSADRSAWGWANAAWKRGDARAVAGAALRGYGPLRVGGGTEAPLSDYRAAGFFLRAEDGLVEGVTLGVNVLSARVRDAGRTDELGRGRFRFYDNDDDLAWLDLRVRDPGPLRELRVAASLHRTDEAVEQYRCAGEAAQSACIAAGRAARVGGEPGPELSRIDHGRDGVWTPGLLALASLALGDWVRATAGLDAYVDLVDSSRATRRAPVWDAQAAPRGNFSPSSFYAQGGAFVQAEGQVLSAGGHRLLVAAGARVAGVGAQAPSVPGIGDLSYGFAGLSGSASVRWLHAAGIMAYASLAQGFRAPNLQETTVLGDTGSKFELPNAALRPESNRALEAGARMKLGPLRAEIAGFAAFIADAIDERLTPEDEWRALGIAPEDVAGKPVVQRVNRPGARYLGAEATVRTLPRNGLSTWASVAWIHGDVERDGATVPARRVPPTGGAVGLRYDAPTFYAEAHLELSGAQTRLHPSDEQDLRICEDPRNPGHVYAGAGLPCPGTPAWATVNLRGGWQVRDGLRAEFAWTNLTDTRYRTHGSGVDAPGVGLRATLVAEW